jgi:hypothetical protein
MTAGWQHTNAFVIQLQPETDIPNGRFEGRVEHVASGRATRFHSLSELIAFLGRVLDDTRAGARLTTAEGKEKK